MYQLLQKLIHAKKLICKNKKELVIYVHILLDVVIESYPVKNIVYLLK